MPHLHTHPHFNYRDLYQPEERYLTFRQIHSPSLNLFTVNPALKLPGFDKSVPAKHF